VICHFVLRLAHQCTAHYLCQGVSRACLYLLLSFIFLCPPQSSLWVYFSNYYLHLDPRALSFVNKLWSWEGVDEKSPEKSDSSVASSSFETWRILPVIVDVVTVIASAIAAVLCAMRFHLTNVLSCIKSCTRKGILERFFTYHFSNHWSNHCCRPLS